jgi:biopolymer transport protein ExbB/TolQ
MKNVFSKIAKASEQIKELEAKKVELFSIEDADQAAAYLEDVAVELIGLKKSIQQDMRRIEGYTQDGIEQFRSLLSATQEIERMAKQLGVNPMSIAQYKSAQSALDKWSQANSMKI